MTWVVLIIVAGVMLYLIFNLKDRSAQRVDFIHTTIPSKPSDSSLYQLIREQVEKAPDQPVDYTLFPSVQSVSNEISLAPGLMDALVGGTDKTSKGWQVIRDAIKDINRGRIKDWQTVENAIKGITTSSQVDSLLHNLAVADVSPAVKRIFWDLARNSHDYEGVKWGIAVGGIFLAREELRDLLLFARHGEFSLYTSHVLIRESERHPEFKQHLIALLPVCRQWAVIRVIDYVVADKELIADLGNQEKVLVFGMENNDGIPMEVAFTIAKFIDVPFFLDQARDNRRVRTAVILLFESLLTEPQPLGGIHDLNDGRNLFERYLSLVQTAAPDFEVLRALHGIELFLKDEDRAWVDREQLLDKVKKIYDSILKPDILRAGLWEDRNRWLACKIIKEMELSDLLPDIVNCFKAKPDRAVMDAMGCIGAAEQLEMLLQQIPAIVDLGARENVPRSKINIHGAQGAANMDYALIVRYLGRLGTPEAVRQIKTAAEDYDPQVRSAAMAAIVDLPPDRVDDRLKRQIMDCLADSPPYLVEAAEKAAARLGISNTNSAR